MHHVTNKPSHFSKLLVIHSNPPDCQMSNVFHFLVAKVFDATIGNKCKAKKIAFVDLVLEVETTTKKCRPPKLKAGFLNCKILAYVPNLRGCLPCQRFEPVSESSRVWSVRAKCANRVIKPKSAIINPNPSIAGVPTSRILEHVRPRSMKN